jgi:polyisoprenyl-teichoic acid--peptidoglycan teichoic acid transferase
MRNENVNRLRRSGARQKARRRRLAVSGIAAATLLVVLAGWLAWHFWTRPFSSDAPEPVAALDSERFTMLVLGTDDRPDEPGRSDTMMLAFADMEQGTVKLLSLPRDSFVSIPGHGWDKLNAAYPLGKTDLTRKTVEQLIGIRINYTVAINMQGFQQVVDAVGGVDLTLDANMDYEDPYDNPPLKIHLKKGTQHLFGEDALHYVRFRHDAESDWGRMKRQQAFLSALAKAVQQPGNLARLPQLVKLVTQNVTTNLSPSQLSRLALIAKAKGDGERITAGGTLTGDDIWSPYGYYLGLHFKEMRSKVRELAGLPDDGAATAKDARDAVAYAAALPRGSSTADAAPAQGAEPPKDGAAAPAAGTPGAADPSAPGTPAPDTPDPGTPAPGTPAPGTPAPGTPAPGTPAPGTPDPGTPAPGTPDPGTPDPGTPAPGTPDPGTPDPGTPAPGDPAPGPGTGAHS